MSNRKKVPRAVPRGRARVPHVPLVRRIRAWTDDVGVTHVANTYRHYTPCGLLFERTVKKRAVTCIACAAWSF